MLMKFDISEASRKLKIEKDVIETMSNIFSDYLTTSASTRPLREFSLDDLRVLNYIKDYWEDKPDIEYIKIGLNSRSHFEYPYDQFILSLAPIFTDPPPEIEEPLPSYVLFNEVKDGMEFFHLANAYKTGGDLLIDAAIRNQNGYEIIYPIAYNYRHAVELYLKSHVGSMGNTHEFMTLYRKFKELMLERFQAEPAEWFEGIINSLNQFDPKGVSFRYGTSMPRYEVFVDLLVFKSKMNLLSEAFLEIKNQLQNRVSP